MPRGPNGTPTGFPAGSVMVPPTSFHTPTASATLLDVMSFSSPGHFAEEAEAAAAALGARQHGSGNQRHQRDDGDHDESVGEGQHLRLHVQHLAEIFVGAGLLLLK